MSLLARLENLALQLPESHFPAPGQIGRLLGALVLYAEHGEEVLSAAEQTGPDAEQTVHTFLTDLAEQENQRLAESGNQPPQSQVPPGPVQVQSAPVPVPVAQTEQPSVAELVAQLQAAQAQIAQLQQERGSVESSPAAGTGGDPAGEPPSDSAASSAGPPEYDPAHDPDPNRPFVAPPGTGFVPPSGGDRP